MNKDNSKISLTEEDLGNIIKYFERDRERVTKELNTTDVESDMYLQILKSFREQILENQKIAERVRDQKQYHALCEGKFDSNSEIARFHHAIWEELHQIENGK